MKQIQYAGARLVLSDEGAAALLEYGLALIRTGEGGVASIPIVGAEGEPETANLLLGPSSQLLATPWTGPDVELEDADAVKRLLDRARSLSPSRVVVDVVKIEDLTFHDPHF